jgi:acylphosphatase
MNAQSGATNGDGRMRLHARVRGDVQGVGFRYFVERRARADGLDGWVRNDADGSVECVAEGPRPALESLLRALHKGPTGAAVERVDAEWEQARQEPGGFRVVG